MVPFGGWEMPLSYPEGTLEEHRRCREAAVVFDVSHLGTVRVEGPGAEHALQRCFSNDLRRIGVGRAQYTHLLDPEDASVVDDIIVWWVGEQSFDVMPNASNTGPVREALAEESSDRIDIRDTTSSRAVLAVQGPEARRRLASVSPEAAAVGRFRVEPFRFSGFECISAGTGYTGEDGVECAVPVAAADAFWRAVVDSGITPAGLGARDTLRLEAALPLHGNELGPGITPFDAGLGWVVGWDKDDFRGRAALEAARTAGPTRVLRGILVEGRRPPRSGQTVRRDGADVGVVTSGNFSPTLGAGIALAFLTPDVDVGDDVVLDVRGTDVRGTCVDLPFVTRS